MFYSCSFLAFLPHLKYNWQIKNRYDGRGQIINIDRLNHWNCMLQTFFPWICKSFSNACSTSATNFSESRSAGRFDRCGWEVTKSQTYNVIITSINWILCCSSQFIGILNLNKECDICDKIRTKVNQFQLRWIEIVSYVRELFTTS